jgi:hypothetical protein
MRALNGGRALHGGKVSRPSPPWLPPGAVPATGGPDQRPGVGGKRFQAAASGPSNVEGDNAPRGNVNKISAVNGPERAGEQSSWPRSVFTTNVNKRQVVKWSSGQDSSTPDHIQA